MAFPLAAIPWLAAVLGAAFYALIKFLVGYVGRRLAVALAAVALVLALTAALFAGMMASIASLNHFTPPPIQQAFSLIVPMNLPLVFSVVLSARILRWVYEWNIKIIQWKLF